MFFIKLIEIIVDSPTVVRNNTERSRVPFTQFHPKVAFCKTTVQITTRISR